MTRIPTLPGGELILWEFCASLNKAFPVVVSFFTDYLYMRDAFDLVRSCQAHGLDYSVHQTPDLGSWILNTNHKPRFLKTMSQAFPDRALLWLDADARVRQVPELFRDAQFPIAYRTWHQKPASGTVFMAPGPDRDKILEQWIRAVEEAAGATDQVCMGRACQKLGIQHKELPATYCQIFDLDPETQQFTRYPSPKATVIPVIEHLQTSRIAKASR